MMGSDAAEIDKFDQLAHEWWNLDGEFRTLHQLNPVRLKFMQNHVDSLANKKIIDIGCGGGILAEGMASLGAIVTAIDLSKQSIATAKLHLFESRLNIIYECTDVTSKAQEYAGEFDILTCMEMLEHTSDPEDIIDQCSRLLKPDGLGFFSTINRNLKSYALGVVAAEYIINIIPRGTHDYTKFIKPSKLRSLLAQHQLELIDIKGIRYNPLTQKAKLGSNVDINYIVACRKLS
ncbi:MAG: 2-polyprenyl-6-hydroxyphenyl methylase / 3-demethylubiquinone-9 3-methyltransferase [Pseudomonadota bacterium]|nr:2-polyprenyl-6-hydroxyphenyl methylase / 3-demethylubiquinone-9 3-methyltransferase [Pseudomonadota bacterium]